MLELFPSVAALAKSGYVFRILDNGGATADRYTVIFSDGDYLAMSGSPSHPQGVSLTGENIDLQGVCERVESGEEIDLALGDLPGGLAEHIRFRVNQGWEDFLEDVDENKPGAVARTRAEADPNEGLCDQGGVGIYAAGDGFCVRLDSDDAREDRGPFMTAREALLATLPDQYSLAGEEYHSTVNVGRLEPDSEVLTKVAALVAVEDAKYEADRDARLNRIFGA